MKRESRKYDNSSVLVFAHVPKTAGTSLIKAISASIEAPAFQPGFDRMLFGEFSDFASMSPEARKVVWPQNSGFVTGCERFVATHMALSTLRTSYPEAQFITILREPVARILSHWLYWRVVSDTELETWGKPWGDHIRISRQPLARFLEAANIAAHTDNLYLRTLVWPHPLVPNRGFIDPSNDEELLACAMAKLNEFDFSGVLEDPAFQDNLSRWIGCRILLPRENRVRSLPPTLMAEYSPELANAAALLGARSRLDLTLWKNVVTNTTTENVEALHVTTMLKSLARLKDQLEKGQEPAKA